MQGDQRPRREERFRAVASRAGRALARLAPAATVVLCYHDVGGPADADNWMRVPSRLFRRQIAMLAALGRWLSPEDVGRKPDGRAPGLRFLLTFDDGYTNWPRYAAPILEEYQAPALFFVSSGHLGSSAFWFDRVVWAIQSGSAESLDLRPHGLAARTFRPGPPPHRWEDIQRLLVDMKRSGQPGEKAFDDLVDRIERVGDAGRVPPPRAMTLGDLRRLSASTRCHIGSHGHSHRILTRLSDSELTSELCTSRAFLEETTGRPVRDLAYPNGDWSEAVVRAVRRAGYERAYVASRRAPSCADRFSCIPRLLVGAWDSPAALVRRIARALLDRRFRTALRWTPPTAERGETTCSSS